jgi:large subunit ribosomal protein L15
MLTLNELHPTKGSTKKSKRVGRGSASGWGTTAGYGNNGAKARSGAKNKPYFEGGQIPLTRRLPKRGFHNRFKIHYQIVNVGDLQKIEFDTKEIDAQQLYDKGLVHSKNKPIKILGNGDISKVLTIKAHAFSKIARDKIEKIKGKAEVVTGA